METKLASSWSLISQAQGRGCRWLAKASTSWCWRLLFVSFSRFTAKPLKTAGARGGASAGDRGAALQAWLWQVCGGGMFNILQRGWSDFIQLERHKKGVWSVLMFPCSFPPQDRVCELKEEVRLQYQRMHQLLEEDLGRTLEALDRAQARFCQENAAQVLVLGEQRHEAQKLLSSIHTAFNKAEELSFMKNTKPVKILTDRWANRRQDLKMNSFSFCLWVCLMPLMLPKWRLVFNFAFLLALVAGLRHVWAAVSLLTKWGIWTRNCFCLKSQKERRAWKEPWKVRVRRHSSDFG